VKFKEEQTRTRKITKIELKMLTWASKQAQKLLHRRCKLQQLRVCRFCV